MMKEALTTFAAGLLLAGTALAAEGDKVTATIEGEGINGEATMEETASGTILIEVRAEGVPEGEHGIHIHETGECDAADGFKSAGGHVAGELEHGVRNQNAPHPGDLPNVHAQAEGVVNAQFFVRGFALGQEGEPRVMDDDGSAIVLHSGADDYSSQPAGDSGDRIACGVFEAAQ